MLRLITTSLLLAVAAPAFADQPSYTFIEGGYQNVELDDDFGPSFDGDGFNLGGSFEVGDQWHIFAGYASSGFDFGVDLNELTLGGGFHTAMSPNTSFFAELAWVNLELDVSGFGSADESGTGVALGLRSNLSERFELAGNISYVDLGDGADGTSVGAAGWYRFNEAVALGLRASVGDDTTTFGLSGRVYFGY